MCVMLSVSTICSHGEDNRGNLTARNHCSCAETHNGSFETLLRVMGRAAGNLGMAWRDFALVFRNEGLVLEHLSLRKLMNC